MTLTELVTILRETGYPVAYSHFNGPPPSVPFITYIETDSTNFHADNRTYKPIKNIQVELYTNKKNLDAEATLESQFDQHDLPYETIETYIEQEQLFQKIYFLGVI